MSNVVITCGICQNSYPKEQFVLCNSGREVCWGCVEVEGSGAVIITPMPTANEQISQDLNAIDENLTEVSYVSDGSSTDGNAGDESGSGDGLGDGPANPSDAQAQTDAGPKP